MRIVTLFFRTSVKTGAHKRYLELLTEFNKIGHEVLLLHWKDVTYQLPKVQRISFSQKINYHTNDYIECFTIICNRNKIKKEIKNADCIFVFGEGNFLQALLISKILGNIPIITAVRSNFVEAAIKVQKAFVVNSIIRKSLRYINLKRLVLLEKLILKKSQGIILQTEYDARSILQRNPRSTTHYEIVPNSINASWIKENTAEKNRSTVCRKLIYVGSIGKRKGFYFLFTAVRKLIEEGYDISLEVCGKGRKTKLYRKKVQKNNEVKKRIIFSGHVKDVLNRIAKSDLLVIPSVYDSFPNVIFEAVKVGTPVIGSNTGGIPTMLEKEELLFSPADSISIYEKLKKLYKSPEEYKKIKEICNNRQHTYDFDWAKNISTSIQRCLDSR